MLLTGLLVVIAAYLIHRAWGRCALSIPLAAFGAAVFGVGVFPGNVTPWHGIFALLTFVSGGVAAVLSSRVVPRPFSSLCGFLGGISLAMLLSVFLYGLVLATPHPLSVLGPAASSAGSSIRSSCGSSPSAATCWEPSGGRRPRTGTTERSGADMSENLPFGRPGSTRKSERCRSS